MDLKNGSFDIVLNIEASHCYGDMSQFLAEVARVLRPGGLFLFADLRRRREARELHDQMLESGLELIVRESITSNVLHALEVSHDLRMAHIRWLVPRPFHGFFVQFTGARGSRLYGGLESGTVKYLHYILKKPNRQPEEHNR